jgi:hypothetical protein
MKVSSFMPKLFVNGSTLGSTFILLNSTSEAHPNGLEMPVVNWS